MYQVFLGKMQLPITPSKIETVINGRNETVSLVSGQEINLIKRTGLTDISFEFIIPSQNYPFTTLTGVLSGLTANKGLLGGVVTTAILEYLEYLKTGTSGALSLVKDNFLNTEMKHDGKGLPFQFIVARIGQGMRITNVYNTNMTVTLENYTITEDANNGMDVVISVNLKQYVKYATKVYRQ